MKMLSICLATHNGEKFIYETLKSIQNQTYTDFEVIIVDDYSTDETVNIIIESFVKKDKRFKIYINNTDNTKPYIDSHNKSYEYASGNLLFRVDQDNILHKDYIAFVVNAMNMHECDALCTYVTFFKYSNELNFEKIEYITNERMYTDSNNFNKNNLYYVDYHYDSWFNQASVIKRSFLISHEECKFKFAKQGDILFWLSCLANKCKMVSIPDNIHMMHRIHDNNAFNDKIYNSILDQNSYTSYVNFLIKKIRSN